MSRHYENIFALLSRIGGDYCSTSGFLPDDGKRLPAGNYTAIVRSVNGTMGVALVEVYDLPLRSAPHLLTVSWSVTVCRASG